ncbi:MAG: alginate lyase family protein [Roseivivax sp.]|nr:alginate lyase family protein [Roseivivax sp.]
MHRIVSLAAAGLAVAIATFGAPSAARAFDCPKAPEPVLTLAFGSRYSDAGEGSKKLDEDASAKVDNALEPVDEFLRSLTELANQVPEAGDDARAIADCAIGQIGDWARANAMADLRDNARLTAGARLAGFGLVLLQTVPQSPTHPDLAPIRTWLEERMLDQMIYWEAEAPEGAARGNLRAWSALAGATIGTVLDDPVIRGWSAWSSTYVLCSAAPDGSLPQEMSRGKFALHYQLHAIAPLTVSAALLSRRDIALADRCDGALARVVNFAVNDIAQKGALSQAITGEKQTLFDGSDTLEGWQLAWLEAYLTIQFDPKLIALADAYRPLSYSKLGGDQTLLWSQMRW